MGGFGVIPPQMQQQLLAHLAQAQQGAGGGQQGNMPSPGMPQVPMQMPNSGQPTPQMPRFQTSSGTMMLPGGTASPSVPGVPASATSPQNKSRMIGQGMIGTVLAVKNQIHDSKVQKARQLASQYIALMQNDDPKMKEMANKMLQDPKVHKVFDAAVTKPGSPEYDGVQMAYRDQMSQEQQKTAMEEMQAKMQEQQGRAREQEALAQRQQATAQREMSQASNLDKKTEKMGQVTPEKQAAIDAKMNVVSLQLKSKMQQTQMQTQAMLQAVDKRVAGNIKVSGMRAKTAAGVRMAKNDETVIKRYNLIREQISDLNKQSKDLYGHLDKETHWYNDPEDTADVQQRLLQIEQQRNDLGQQLQQLQVQDQQYQKTGFLSPQVKQGDGSQQNPHVLP